MRPRVLLAGLFHETHTFLPGETPLADFTVRRGADLLAAAGDGSPLAGVVEAGRAAGWEFIPTIDLRATPSATADDSVLESCWSEFSSAASQQAPHGIDGVMLVLHGAMVSRSHEDVEGELLRRMRQMPELAAVPIGGVIDLHANFSPAMARYADCLFAYQENPHVDAYRAGRRAAELLDIIIRQRLRTSTVLLQPPLVWAPTGTATAADPMRTLEAMARAAESADGELLAVNVLAGFAFADTRDTGPAFTAVTTGDPERARKKLAPIVDWAVTHRELGSAREPTLEEITPQLNGRPEGPVLLVEPSDNIGGGAPGDGVAILRAMLDHQWPRCGVIINDPLSAAQCQLAAQRHATTPGGAMQGAPERLSLAIGGRENAWAGGPVELNVELLSTSDGRFELSDRQSHLASMCGVSIDMGPSAVVRHKGITILLTSKKTPPFDLGQWTSQGVDPRDFWLIGVKAAVAHRQGYDPITRASFTVDTPGPCSSNLSRFPFKRLRRPIYPLDPL